MKQLNFIWLVPISISSMHSSCIAQQISEGGVRSSATSRDQYIFSSSVVSGTQSGASATVRGGTINTGIAKTMVESELNPIVNPKESSYLVRSLIPNSGRLPLVDRLNYIQNSDLSTINKDKVITTSKGNLEDNLKIILSNNLNLVNQILLPGNSARNMPIRTDLTTEFENLTSAMNETNQLTNKRNSGAHILNHSHQNIMNATVKRVLSIGEGSLFQWSNGKQVKTKLVDQVGDTGANNDQLISITKNDSSTKTSATVLGFNKKPNPNDGKKINISAYSSNTRTPGKLVIQKDEEGKTPTLADIAMKYGISEEELRIINNLSNDVTDLTNYSLIVPAETIKNGSIKILDGDTWQSIAKRYGVTKEWLLSLNGLSEKSAPTIGENLQIPGLVSKDGRIEIIKGETFAQIAERHGLSEIQILEYNRLDKNSKPIVGGFLMIPNLQSNQQKIRLPAPKPLLPELEFADFGAYTSIDVTYTVRSSKIPLFMQQIQTNLFSK